MPDLIQLASAAAPALLFLTLPFLASVVVALGCAGVHGWLKRQPAVGGPAGDWLLEQVERHGPYVKVALAPEIAGSMDGYWPDSRYIGLSPRTWIDTSPAGRAVASHELGHALAWSEQPERSRMLATGRKMQQHAITVAGAGFLTAALTDSRIASAIAIVALIVSLAGHVATLIDEGDASWRARGFLEARGLRTRGTDLAMLAAFSVYLAPAVVHGGFLVASPMLLRALWVPTELQTSNGALGLWAILLLSPFLMLRTAQVIVESSRPAAATTEFRLNWTLFQERSWEFHSGVIVLLWLVLTYDQPVSQGLGPLFVVAAIPAMGPLANIGKMLVVLPVWFVLSLAGFTGEPPRTRVHAPDPPDVLDLVPTTIGWPQRLGGLIRVAWLPLLAVLVTRAVSGW